MVLHKTKPPAVDRAAQSDFHHLIASALPFSGKGGSRSDALGVLMTISLFWVTMLLMRVILAN